MARKPLQMKLPNGFGSITKLSGNRRNPFMVCVTIGWDNSGKQLRQPIGYVDDWWDGYDMLREYHKNPNYLDDLEKQKITTEFIFESLNKKLKDNIGKPGMSLSNYKNLHSAWNNQCVPIHQKPIMQLTHQELQNLINNCGKGQTTKGYIKNVLDRIFEHAKLNFNINVNLEIVERLDAGSKENSELHTRIINSELKKIWEDYYSNPTNETEIVLILIACGLRPQELIDLEIENIFLEEHCMYGGCKTKAGRNRLLPIHDDVYPFIEKRKRSNQKYLIENIPGKKTTYKFISKVWNEVMLRINSKHIPGDARHTFASMLDEYKLLHPNGLIDDYFIKKVIGHSLTNNVTQNVYTHRDKKYYVDAINLINLKGDE